MIVPETRIEKNDQIVARELTQGEGVLLHLDTGSYHGVDPVGWLIWSLIDGARTVSDIAVELRSRVEEAPDRLDEDVSAFLQGLRERDLIK